MQFFNENSLLSLASVKLLVFVHCLLFFVKADIEDNLVAVIAYTRHGHRAPLESFPTDKYFNKTYWPNGFGQLTQAGMKGQYKLGKWFRQRYNTFLKEIYSPEDIYIYSTNQDRTLMSAYAILAGLYPPTGFQVWNQQIPWQPIPVRTDTTQDHLLVRGLPCKKFDDIFKKTAAIVHPALEKKHAALLEYIRSNAGWPEMDLNRVRIMRSTLYTYRYYNSSFIPEWAKSLDQNTLDYLAARVYELPTSTTSLARLHIGVFFNYITKHFDHFLKPSSITPKFLLISGHDSSMISILDAMGAFNMKPIGYDDTTIWELRRGSDGGYFVNLLLKRKNDLEKLNVHGCDFNCDYNEFKWKMSNVSVSLDQLMKECNENL